MVEILEARRTRDGPHAHEPQVVFAVHRPLQLALGQRRGDAGGEYGDRDDRGDHPAGGHDASRQRCRRVLRRAGLRHRDGGPPHAGAEALGPAAEMLGLAPLQQPDHQSDAQRDAQERQHRLKEAE